MITTISALPVPFPQRHTPSTKHEIPEQPEDPFDQLPSDLVEAALAMLSKDDIPLIPWGSLLYRSMDVPKVLTHFQFLVPDELLDVASRKVSSMRLPLTQPPSLLLKREGDLISKGFPHRLSRETTLGSVQYLHLLPLSFAGFQPSEWTEHHQKAYTICMPRLSAVYAALFRILASYRRKGHVCSSLTAELELLVNCDLLGLSLGYHVPEDDKGWDEPNMRAREKNAVCMLRNWATGGEWRDGEEWVGDALVAIVRGSGDLDYLPWNG
ncbi:hypothetical protein BC629DRAFT_1282336 [Irpex lacteus]|nr:hypothetical protein BC629DRAFT_1282336 [Irpex lacteus]